MVDGESAKLIRKVWPESELVSLSGLADVTYRTLRILSRTHEVGNKTGKEITLNNRPDTENRSNDPAPQRQFQTTS